MNKKLFKEKEEGKKVYMQRPKTGFEKMEEFREFFINVHIEELSAGEDLKERFDKELDRYLLDESYISQFYPDEMYMSGDIIMYINDIYFDGSQYVAYYEWGRMINDEAEMKFAKTDCKIMFAEGVGYMQVLEVKDEEGKTIAYFGSREECLPE